MKIYHLKVAIEPPVQKYEFSTTFYAKSEMWWCSHPPAIHDF